MPSHAIGHEHHRQRFSAVTVPGGTLGARLLNSAPGISQSLRATGTAPAISLRTLCNSHVDATQIVGRRPHGGSNELPEAYAESIVGVGR
jgi:hypothetical protein